jgi:hypothetical protein
MPGVNISQVLAAAWPKVVTDSPEDQIFADRWLFQEFTTKNGGLKKIAGGPQIEATIEVGTNTTFRSYSDLEALDVARIDVFDAARYDWREHSGTITYSVLQDFKAGGDTSKFDLIAGLVENAKNSHKNDISRAMYANGTGNGGKDLHGLQLLVPDNPAIGTVGQINAATFTFWRSQQALGTMTATPFDNLRARMRTMYNTCSFGISGEHPQTLVTTQTVFEGYESLLVANERNVSKRGEHADAGYKNEVLKFKGANISYDPDAPAGRMYFLNPKFLKLWVSKNHFMKLGKELEPVNQNLRVRKVHTIIQMGAVQRRRLGVLTVIT